MKHKIYPSYLRFIYALIGILWLSSVTAAGQVRFGVFWQLKRGEVTSRINPDQYIQMRITHFVIGSAYANELPNSSDTTQRQQYHILAAPPLRFLTAYDLRKHHDLLVNRLYKKLEPFISDIHPDGYGIVQLSEIHSKELMTYLKPIVKQLRDSVRSSIYYIRQPGQEDEDHVSDLFDFSLLQINEKTDITSLPELITPKTRGIYFDPEETGYFDQAHLQALFKEMRADSSIVLYLNGKWLQDALRTHPNFKNIITAYATDASAIFSNPVPKNTPVNPGFTVLILVLIWLITAIHYGFEPNYRKSLIRYFGYHRFFIDDIQERVLRFSNSNVIVLLIQALTGALLLISFTHFFISKTGFSAISAHYPAFHILGGSDIRLFIIIFAAVIVYNLICSLWLFISAPDFPQYNQVLTLQLWPQHLNLLLVSLLVTLTIAYQSPILVYLCGLFYLIVLLSSFIIASADIYAYSESKGLFLIKSMLPYLVLVIIVLVWIISYTGITDVWLLARSLQ